jgi:hypothetical protein
MEAAWADCDDANSELVRVRERRVEAEASLDTARAREREVLSGLNRLMALMGDDRSVAKPPSKQSLSPEVLSVAPAINQIPFEASALPVKQTLLRDLNVNSSTELSQVVRPREFEDSPIRPFAEANLDSVQTETRSESTIRFQGRFGIALVIAGALLIAFAATRFASKDVWNRGVIDPSSDARRLLFLQLPARLPLLRR